MSLPSNSLPEFEAYYDAATRQYWIRNDRGGWVDVRESSLRRHMRGLGYRNTLQDGEKISGCSPANEARICSTASRTPAIHSATRADEPPRGHDYGLNWSDGDGREREEHDRTRGIHAEVSGGGGNLGIRECSAHGADSKRTHHPGTGCNLGQLARVDR